jgi:FkbM family methyltransferase
LSLLKKKIGFLKSKLIYDLKPFANAKLIKFYAQFIESGDLCFDVGCHTGNRAKSWLSLNAEVVAFEPQPYFIGHLKNRFKSESKFKLIEKGVGSQVGELSLMISSLYPTISTFSNKWKEVVVSKLPGKVYDESTMVSVTTLDTMISLYGIPSFCKIDVEGHELEVLLGLSHKIPTLSFEFFSEEKESVLACIERLSQIGNYEFNWSVGESLKMESDVWMDEEELKKIILAFHISNSGDVYAQLKKE